MRGGVRPVAVALFLTLLETLLTGCTGDEAKAGPKLVGPIRINCGSDEPVLYEGNTWQADDFVAEGTPDSFKAGPGSESPLPVSELFTKRRVFYPPGTGGCYRLPLAPNRYIVRVSFAPTNLSSCAASGNKTKEGHVGNPAQQDLGGWWGEETEPSDKAPASDASDGTEGSEDERVQQERAWISVAVSGQQMEVVRTELHQQHVYRTEYTVDTSALQGIADHNASAELLSVCFGALEGTAYVSSLEVLPVPAGLYSGVYGEGISPRGFLASRDRLAAAASLGLPTRDIAGRKWLWGDSTYGTGVTTQDLMCSGDMAASYGGSNKTKGDEADNAGAENREESNGTEEASPHGAGVSGQRIVRVAQANAVEGANEGPFFLAPGLLQAVFEARPAWHRLHFEWYFRAVSRKNPWVLVLALLEPNATAAVGERVFDIVINGEVVVRGFDPLAPPMQGGLLKVKTSTSLLGKSFQGVGVGPAQDGDQQHRRQAQADGGVQGQAVVEYRLGGSSAGGPAQQKGGSRKGQPKKWGWKLGPGASNSGAEGGRLLARGKDEGGSGDGVKGGEDGGDEGGRGPKGQVRRRVLFVVITVWNRRPSFLRTMPSLELDLVQAQGSVREPALCAVEVFEVFKGVSTLKASTRIGNGGLDDVSDTPVRVESESDPFASPEGEGSRSNGGVIAAAVIASVGGVALVASVAFLGILWRRHSLRRAERLRQLRGSPPSSSSPSVSTNTADSRGAGSGSPSLSLGSDGSSPPRPALGGELESLEERGVVPLVPPGGEPSAVLRPRHRSIMPRALSEIEEEGDGANMASSAGDVEMGEVRGEREREREGERGMERGGEEHEAKDPVMDTS